MVSTSVLNCLMEISVLSFVFPVVILLAWKMRTHKSLVPAFAGIFVFLIFAKVLESVPYALCLGMENPVSGVLRSNYILYAVYLGVAAAIFEEVGRYLAFRYFLPKYDECQNAITYGIGHGGIECMIVLGWSDLQYYMTAIILNNGKGLSDLPKTMQSYFKNLTAFDCIADGISAVFLLVLQVCLSIFIFQAVRNEKLQKRLFGLSMIFHMAFYIPNGFYQAKLIPHIVSLLLELLITGIALVLAVDIYKKMNANQTRKKSEQKRKESAEKGNVWNVASRKLTNLDEEKEDK